MTEAEKAYQYFVIAVPENEEQAKAYFWARKALQSALTPPNEPLTPCDVCRFSPPSSGGGKPCCLCPADRLAAYEDTGLEPEEIIELKARMEGLEK